MVVYLDHAATTPMTAAVRAVYLDALELVGNPSSIHSQGQAARRELEQAREDIATSLGADAVELVFTSGGTESINLAIKGLYWERQRDGVRPVILVPEGEHHATVDSVEWLEEHDGAVVHWLPVDRNGRLGVDTLTKALEEHGERIALLAFLWANNEVGTVQPVAELVRVAAEAGVPAHVDAVSAFGYLPIDFHAIGAAALSVSAHKIGGPVGIGALVLSRSHQLVPLVHGGNQQRVRSGTMDVAGAVAFAQAARDAVSQLETFRAHLERLRDRLIDGVRIAVPEAVLRGDPDPAHRLPGNAHFTFPGCEGDSLLMLLDMAGICVSTGSACQAGVPETSHVLLGMAVPPEEARGALRFTLGHGNTVDDVDALLAALPGAFESARRAGLANREV